MVGSQLPFIGRALDEGLKGELLQNLTRYICACKNLLRYLTAWPLQSNQATPVNLSFDLFNTIA